ncbi:hypothetical protein PFICI_05371 [Pestalotiopsis fici W106-1]|uniref:MYND-type domain-containing protein n=1 Tax=Pestalotiopsis fici (strain W106-1 / CGMCC3.15140) TaxID=1229662 RepID=W3XBS4_PESFW|nr:uncharacterized protein PFICI_05371 [Pestalotiopsis fici W106-1]ETS83495.1 hypothetical protein PFICI_05371 [Pestalotiopsis fici W106-1]
MSTPTTPKCANEACQSGQRDNLLACGRCQAVQYCSKGCQKQDWKYHKVPCQKAAGVPIGSLACNQKFAIHDPKAQTLAKDMGMKPSPADFLAYPLRRLALTRKDTPGNLPLFFGDRDRPDIRSAIKEFRIEALLRPPPGSPTYAHAKPGRLEEGLPAWTPQPASLDEAKEVQEIRKMQQIIVDHSGPRGTKDITSDDMMSILTIHYPERWAEMLPLYNLTLNALDQGAQA